MLADLRYAVRSLVKAPRFTAILGVVAVAAVWLPARRATRVDPIVALRTE